MYKGGRLREETGAGEEPGAGEEARERGIRRWSIGAQEVNGPECMACEDGANFSTIFRHLN
jgi:hypothetical protein